MDEIVLDSCLSCIREHISKGIEMEGWRLVFSRGIVWIENEQIGLRIRTCEPSKTVSDYLQARVDMIEEHNFSEELVRTRTYVSAIYAQTPCETAHFRAVSVARRAGLLGCDRAGGY